MVDGQKERDWFQSREEIIRFTANFKTLDRARLMTRAPDRQLESRLKAGRDARASIYLLLEIVAALGK